MVLVGLSSWTLWNVNSCTLPSTLVGRLVVSFVVLGQSDWTGEGELCSVRRTYKLNIIYTLRPVDDHHHYYIYILLVLSTRKPQSSSSSFMWWWWWGKLFYILLNWARGMGRRGEQEDERRHGGGLWELCCGFIIRWSLWLGRCRFKCSSSRGDYCG